jgi:hypothetical protein
MSEGARLILNDPEHRVAPVGLTGAWINTESIPRGVAQLVIERRSDATGIWALGADDPSREGWGWTDAEATYAASAAGGTAVAFTASFQNASMPVELQANVSKGLLIVSSFRIRDASFAREFFYRIDPGELEAIPVAGQELAARLSAPTSSASSFVGTWGNTNLPQCGIAWVKFEATGNGVTMQVLGIDESGQNDWGRTTVEVYSEPGTTSSEPAKIKARYLVGSTDVQLHGWIKQGVLVLALFRRYQDGSGRSNFFDREFFYRTDESWKGVG